ncbi:pathogenicity-like protein [Coralloluteibacterium thermophilus]|uniref:Pathogenicity-like protein n=1 Tax=Coralloluteibacterium thermophilum TaxID=2707049 RepID=A0ABV9NI76_9GAMM
MRQIFSSLRLENVEGVARLLNDNGIETWISQGRSYKGGRRSQFSYRESPGGKPQPAVWVVHTGDQVRARELLREAGLIDTTRPDSFLPNSFTPPPAPGIGDSNRRRRAMTQRIKIALLIVTAAIIAGGMYQVFGGQQPEEAPAEAVETGTFQLQGAG